MFELNTIENALMFKKSKSLINKLNEEYDKKCLNIVK